MFFFQYIKLNIKKSPLLYLIIAICQIISIMIILFGIGTMLNAQSENTQAVYDASFFNYTFSKSKTIEEIEDKVNELSDFISQDLLMISFRVDNKDHAEYLGSYIKHFNKYESILDVFDKYLGGSDTELITYETFINKEKIVVVGTLVQECNVPDGKGDFIREVVEKEIINEYIRIKNEDFKVVGYFSGWGLFVLFDSAPKDSLLSEMGVELKNALSDRRIEEINAKASEIFGRDIEIHTLPQNRDLLSEQYSTINIFISLLIILIAVLNTALIFKFMIDMRIKNFAIYRICGMSKAHCFSYCISENLIISGISYAVAVLIFANFILPVTIYNYSLFEFIYNESFFTITFAIYLLSSLVINLLYISPSVVKSIQIAYKEGI